jgi:hypothetical protein
MRPSKCPFFKRPSLAGFHCPLTRVDGPFEVWLWPDYVEESKQARYAQRKVLESFNWRMRDLYQHKHPQHRRGTNTPGDVHKLNDAELQQLMTGTWFLDYPGFTSTIIISTNGDYAAYRTGGRTHFTKLEGTQEIRGGLIIDTLKKSSIPNGPVPLVFTNILIRVDEYELVYRAQNSSQQMVFWKIAP